MEKYIRNSPYFYVTEETIEKCNADFGISIQTMEESIDIIADWFRQQDHFVEKEINRDIVARLYIASASSIEETKKKIDHYFSAHTQSRDFFGDRNADEMAPLWESLNQFMLPKVSPIDCTRILFYGLRDSEKVNKLNSLTFFRYLSWTLDFILLNDYNIGNIFIYDCSECSVSNLSQLNPVFMKRMISILSGLGAKVKGIHILNAPSFINKALFIIRQVVNEKVWGRIYVHESYEDLYKYVPKEVLPKDYGGDLQSVDELRDMWKKEFETGVMRQVALEADKFKTDEAKRQKATLNEDMGIQGSFRTLNLD